MRLNFTWSIRKQHPAGSIPDFCGSCPFLRSLQLHDNLLSGPLPVSLVHLIGQGGDVSLYGNTGFTLESAPTPPSPKMSLPLATLSPAATATTSKATAAALKGDGGNWLASIEELDLSHCSLVGPLPSFAGCVGLRRLWLRGNPLVGSRELQEWQSDKRENLPQSCIVYC